ncbi:alpha/beta fold hydrolase [Streptomyces sp. M19]
MPGDTRNYTVAKDEERLWAIADALGADTFHLVGHDRGAASTWSMAARRPDRVTSYVALSTGHQVPERQRATSRSSSRGTCFGCSSPMPRNGFAVRPRARADRGPPSAGGWATTRRATPGSAIWSGRERSRPC